MYAPLSKIWCVSTACALVSLGVVSSAYASELRSSTTNSPTPLVEVTTPITTTSGHPHSLDSDISKLSSLDHGTVLVTFTTTTTSNASALLSLSNSNDDSANASLTVNKGHLYWEVRDKTTRPNYFGTQMDAEDALGVADGLPHTAAVVNDGTITSMYLDGQQMFSTTGTDFFDDIVGANSLLVGANRDVHGLEWPFNGTVSHLAVYSQALTGDEIRSLSASPTHLQSLETTGSLTSSTRAKMHDSKFSVNFRVTGGLPASASLNRGDTAVSVLRIDAHTLTFGQDGKTWTFAGDWGTYPPNNVTVTFDGDAIKIYVDGTQLGKGSLSSRSLPTVDRIALTNMWADVYDGTLTTPAVQTLVHYDKPAEHALFDRGYEGAASYRIPSLLLTKNGTLLAGADQRVPSAYDSPNDINLSMRRSTDGGKTWEKLKVLINLPGTGRDAASVIDSVFVQDRKSGRITVLVDLFPGGVGQPNNEGGVGVAPDGRLQLFTPSNEQYLLNSDGSVVTTTGGATNYHVAPDGTVTRDGQRVNNIYDPYKGRWSHPGLYMLRTAYLVAIHSMDDGVTWTRPQFISQMVKAPWMRFFGTGPGTGIQISGGAHDGRLVVPVYFSNHTGRVYSSAVVYSDDGGLTWKRSASPNDGRHFGGHVVNPQTETNASASLHESTVVQTGTNELTLFMRNLNPGQHIGVSRSTDGGVTWSEPTFDARVPEIFSQPNAITLNNGQGLTVFANASARLPYRGQGVLRMSPDGGRTWTHTRTFNEGHYVYQAMVKLPNGNIGLLWEREWQGIYFSEVPLTWLSHYGATEIK